MKRHAELKREMLGRPEVQVEYDRLAPEFELIESLLRARIGAGLTQAQLAKRMGTSQSVIARLEGGNSAPTLSTLRRYAAATGTRLRVSLDA
ncbi:MAG: helix-turn-helix domain-containing protein [Alcanivoracaceae bacterium]|jgi:ribosome-binding protein aMBF1 (putative translation factor)|nr:helix-turn-helix domain-containing protein [Alcanivoracaceae bacterium]